MQQVFIIAAVQRKIVDFLVAECAAKSGGSGVDQRHFFGNGYNLRDLPSLQSEIRPYVSGDFNLNVETLYALEARGFRVDLVGAGLQIWCRVGT